MTLLIGSATPGNPAFRSLCSDGFEQSLKFTALETGTIDTLRLHTSASGASTNSCTSVKLGVRADDSNYPGTILGSGTYSGTPGIDADVDVTGLSIDVIAGSVYWLTLLPIGGDIWVDMTTNGVGGTDDIFTGDGTLIAFPTTPDPGQLSNDDGPAAFQGLGEIAAATPLTGLDWHVTGLWYPDADSVDYYGRIADPQNGNVTIPLNDSRTAEVTLPIDDPLVQNLRGHTYARALKAYHNGTLVFWGIVKIVKINRDDPRTVTISAVDPSIRAIRHYLRRGDIDGFISAANGDRTNISIDGIGMRLILDAARNIPGQTARGCPDIGIDPGNDDFGAFPDDLMGVSRGDEVWNTMVQLSQTLGPDFELEPLDNAPGSYCQLNTYTHQGEDLTDTVQLHYGTGLDNVDDYDLTEGAKYTTHVHVLSRDLTYRFTEVNVEASADTGQYTDWDATDFDSHGIDPDKVEDVLRAFGDEVLKAYGRPLIEVTLVMPVEDDGPYLYGTHYAIGDSVSVAIRDGELDLPETAFRITQVVLNQEDETNSVRPDITVIADRASGDTIGDSGGE